MTAKPMRFSFSPFPYDRWGGVEPIARAAKRAEELGYFGMVMPEHIIMPVRPDVPPVSIVWYDNFVLGAHLATLTKRLRLIFLVMVVPYRPPIQMAKLLSTLDVVSNGRLIAGVGAGWMRGEFRTLGIDITKRGDLTDEYLRAMRALWTQERPEFEGATVKFGNIAFEPKCVQKPHVPLWIGGSGPRPIRRLIELGDGWSPMVGTIETLTKELAAVKTALRAAGRDPEALDYSWSFHVGEPDPASVQARKHASSGAIKTEKTLATPEEIIAEARRFQEAGFNHLTLLFNWQKPADMTQKLEWFAAKVMPAFKG